MTRSAPPGFDLEPLAGGFLLLRRGLLESPLASQLRSGRWRDALEERYSGRGTTSVLVAGGERFVVRRYRHGGLLRALTGARYPSPARAFREAALYDELRRRGVPTLEAVAVFAERSRPFGFRLALVTREVVGARDFFEALRGELAPSERRFALARAGESVRRLHEAGFRHADLNLKNLLLASGDAPSVLVIDLDRGAFEGLLPRKARVRSLARLYRSLRSLEERGGRPIASRADLARFLRAYGEREWKALAREVEAAFRRSLPAHRAAWFLERRLGARRWREAARSASPSR